MSARERILARLAAARRDDTPVAARVENPVRGPATPHCTDPASRFTERARQLASTVARVADFSAVPAEVARYLDAEGLPRRLAAWPEFAKLAWQAVDIEAVFRPAGADDPVGLTGVFAAIGETGTLMVTSGEGTPATTSLLPETHIAVVPVQRLVPTLEDAFALLRREAAIWPRAVNLISGPSRTADIEQTVTLGAHGPYRVHIILVGP
jgi:L-lactate dehydrogenase complex protein LldG